MIHQRVSWSKRQWADFYRAARYFGAPKQGDAKRVFFDAIARAGLPPKKFGSNVAANMNKARMGLLEEPIEEALAQVGVIPEIMPVADQSGGPRQEPEPEPKSATETVAGAIADTLLQVICDPRIRRALRGLVAEVLAPESDLQQTEAITWREPRIGTVRKPRLVVAGGDTRNWGPLRGNQQFDVRFWSGSNDESIHRLKAISNSADVVVVMTKFIGHVPYNSLQARARAGQFRLVHCNGSLDSVLPELAQLTGDGNG